MSAPLPTDFNDAQVTELLGKLWKGTILNAKGLVTVVLWKRHICAWGGNNGRSVKMLTAQMH